MAFKFSKDLVFQLRDRANNEVFVASNLSRLVSTWNELHAGRQIARSGVYKALNESRTTYKRLELRRVKAEDFAADGDRVYLIGSTHVTGVECPSNSIPCGKGWELVKPRHNCCDHASTRSKNGELEGVQGVYLRKRKGSNVVYQARVDGKWGGCFKTVQEAARQRDRMVVKSEYRNIVVIPEPDRLSVAV